MTAELMRGLKLMIGRAILRLVEEVDGGLKVQLDGLADETLDGVDHPQEYGFASRPRVGARAIMAAVGGLRAQSVAIVVEDRRYRLTGLLDGEVGIHDDQGQFVLLKRDGVRIETPFKVEVAAGETLALEAAEEVTLTAPKIVLASDDLNLGGEGGQPVARKTDPVAAGVISNGSTKVKST